MKTTLVGVTLFLLSVGCAATRPPATLAVGETRWETCFPGRSYSEDGTAEMKKMREEGASWSEVSRKVGGTSQEAKCAMARAESQDRSFLIASGKR